MSASDAWPDPTAALKRRSVWGMAAYLAAIAVMCLGSLYVIFSVNPLRNQEIACDRAIEAVMTSRDAIEIQRGSTIVSELGCSVRRRLDPDGRFKPAVEAGSAR